jgi:hypothetical protein
MKPHISPRDLEYLSLYLDKQLSPDEQRRLEKRLQENQPLRQLLDELRETRRVLRAVPKARAPRNFTLTPQMIGSRAHRPVYPALGFVSALASILFILVFVGDLSGIFTRQASSVALQQPSQYEAAAPAMENAQEERVQAADSTHTPSYNDTQPVIVEELKAAESAVAMTSIPEASPAEGGGDETAAFSLAESYAKEAPAPSTGIAGDLPVGAVVTSTEILDLELLPMETSTGQIVTETPVPEGKLAAKAIAEGENADAQEQERLATGAEETGSQDRESSAILPGRWIIWVLEGIFALTALISGALVISHRRRLT